VFELDSSAGCQLAAFSPTDRALARRSREPAKPAPNNGLASLLTCSSSSLMVAPVAPVACFAPAALHCLVARPVGELTVCGLDGRRATSSTAGLFAFRCLHMQCAPPTPVARSADEQSPRRDEIKLVFLKPPG